MMLRWRRKVILALGCLFLFSERDATFQVCAFTPSSSFGHHRSILARLDTPHTGTLAGQPQLQAPWSSRGVALEKRKFVLSSTPTEVEDSDDESGDDNFSVKTTFALIGGQSLLIVFAAIAAYVIGTPNWGFGPGISLDWQSIRLGTLYALPLGVFAAALDLVEDRFPALQDVTTATQRSVLALLGSEWKPRIAFLVALALGLAAGVGEELMFRGVMQYELAGRFGSALAIGVSSFIFGALHAVTPVYAALAALASVYFGFLYSSSQNLCVAIVCHTVYDLGALLFAHWTVSQLSDSEREAVANWEGPKGDVVL